MAAITWSETSVTVNVGETATVNFSYGKELEMMFTVTTSDASVATIATSGDPSAFTGVATITGVSAGTTVTVPGGNDTQDAPLTITVVEADDESYLNKRGLTHFWENIDSAKQDKLTAGTNITISASNTISASQPTVGNATLTIQKNGTSAGTFTANASQNKTINITVPEIKERTGATTTTDITPLYVAGDGTTTTPMALKTHGDAHTGSFAYVNINEPTSDISEAYIGGYVWDEYEEWWRKMSEKKLALYSDIPTVNNGTLTIQKNGTNVQTFTANQSGNVTANIAVPTATSDLTNDGEDGSGAYMDEFAIHATNIDAANGTFTSDKTFDEVKAAYESGKNILLYATMPSSGHSDYIIPLDNVYINEADGEYSFYFDFSVADAMGTGTPIVGGVSNTFVGFYISRYGSSSSDYEYSYGYDRRDAYVSITESLATRPTRNTWVPSAQCVYDAIGDVESILTTLNIGGGAQ